MKAQQAKTAGLVLAAWCGGGGFGAVTGAGVSARRLLDGGQAMGMGELYFVGAFMAFLVALVIGGVVLIGHALDAAFGGGGDG